MVQTIVTYCDSCMSRGEERPAETWQVTLLPPGARKPRAFDVDACETCRKVYADLLDFLDEYGRASGDQVAPVPRVRPRMSEQPTPPASELDCPLCDFVAGRAGGLLSHCRTAHDMTPAEARGDAHIACPHKGCARKFTSGQGVAAHQRSRHDGVVLPLPA